MRVPVLRCSALLMGPKQAKFGASENRHGTKMGPYVGLNGALFSISLFMLTVIANVKNAPFGALCFLFPIEDDFTGSPATHSVEALLEVIHFEVVSDDWC